MRQHTPAPWIIANPRGKSAPEITGPDGRRIAMSLLHMGSEDAAIALANARLMAAAP